MNEPNSSSPPILEPSAVAPRRHWLRRLLCANTIIHLLFWSWHGVWLLGVVFGLAPELLPALIVDTVQGQVPWGITLSAVGLMLLPFLTLAAGWRLRHDHWKLLRLFYGVGGVAFSLLFARLFFIRQATAAVDLLLVTLAAGAAFYTAELFGGLRGGGRAVAIVRMVGGSALLIIGLYVGVVMGLYAIPGIVLAVPNVISSLIELFTSISLLRLLTYSPLMFAFVVFVLYSFSLLLGLPLAVAVLYTRGWWRGFRAWSAQRSPAIGLGITAACAAGWGLAFHVCTQQPQREVLARLAQRPATIAAQDDYAAHASEIRDGLLNAYLAPHRYWGSRGDSVQLARMYRHAFHTAQDVMAPQYLFNAIAAPLLYDGDGLHSDRALAQVRYEQFFDQPLQQGEREAVLSALSATYDRDQAEAGLLDVGRRRVLLTTQDVDIDAQGDVARFTLHEVYENQTWEAQEILYYFSLPEHAAVTGLWLGYDDDPRHRFSPVVAPRGAAQAVYRQQRERRVDPALIEQVGPRQYRLRAFPIPARERHAEGKAPAFHLWLEWTILGDGAGWPAPQLAEARNVYWEPSRTARTIDDRRADHDGWLPSHFEAEVVPGIHTVELGGFRVRAAPASTPATAAVGRLALVLETSRSMQAHADEVAGVLAELDERGVDADLYLAPSPYGAERPRVVPLAAADPRYYGGHTLAGALAQFDALRGDERYDAVVVLSDAGSFGFLQDDAQPDPLARRDRSPAFGIADDIEALRRAAATVESMQLDAPLWMLHFGGLPHAYRDEVGDLLQRTHGGVVTDLPELLERLGGDVVDGHRWSFEALGRSAPAPEVPDAFAPIAARALVAHLSRATDLDTLHAIAVGNRVVTPWSSMIVLVDEAQRDALARASAASDRFDREAESGVEEPSTPFGTLELAATPEPEEWLLLGLALGGLLIRLRPW